MTAPRPAPPQHTPCMAWWAGDPTIIVFAVRYALGVRGHVPEFVRQAIAANVPSLPPPARRAIVTDIRGWLDGAGGAATAEDRAVWIAALAELGET